MGTVNKAFWIAGDILRIDTLVLLGSEEWAEKEVVKRTGLCAISKGFQGSVNAIEDATTKCLKFHVLWVDGEYGSSVWADTLAHEISHLVDRIMEAHEIPSGRESTEIRALTHGWYTRMVCLGAHNRKQKTPEQEWEQKKTRKKAVQNSV